MKALRELPSTPPASPEPGPFAARRGTSRAFGREFAVLMACCLIVQAGAALLILRAGGFWSPDSAVRFLQVESLERSHYRDVSVPYPAGSLDPEGRYFPLGPWFHFRRAGRFFVSYLPYFSMATAPLYRAFGMPGLVIIPAAAGLGIIAITYAVLRRRVAHLAWAGALTVGLGTPLLVYGAVFWDHTVAALFAAGACALIAEETGAAAASGQRMAAGGALLGAGLWTRSEMYPLTLAVLCAWVYAAAPRQKVRGALMMCAGVAGPALCLWALNARLFGSPLGYKGQDLASTRAAGLAHAALGHPPWIWVRERLGNAYYQLASPDFYAFSPHAVAAGLAAAAVMVLGAMLLRYGAARGRRGLVGLGALIAAGAGVWIVAGHTVISGLLPAAPPVVLACLRGNSSRWGRFLWAVCALFTAAVIVTGTHGGLQWGPRYLLPILPLLVWLAASAVEAARTSAPDVWPALRQAAVALMLAGMLTQASGIDQVRGATARNARVNDWVRALPAPVVVTPLEWLALNAGPLYFEKRLMLVHSPEEFRDLVDRFVQQRVSRWSYIPYSGLDFRPQAVEGWTAAARWRFRVVADGTRGGLRGVTFEGAAASP